MIKIIYVTGGVGDEFMPVIKGLEWTFNTEAEKYEKMRPGYVPELYEDIFNYITINKTSNVLEVGIGGGQATLPILKTGCKLTAVEYGENFAKLCRQKFMEFSTFSTVTAKEYISLLGTYSDHIAIEEHTRKKFFSEIEETIHNFGGQIVIYDTIDLQLARKP